LFTGIGYAYFDPRGTTQSGQTVRLKPLSTEGQGLPGGPDEYSSFTPVIPYGIGIKRNLTNGIRGRNSGQWGISFELSFRQTFSDYIDDVSTNYFDQDILRELRGDLAVELSDPSGLFSGLIDNGDGTFSGQQRGDPSDNDSYILGVISINYKPAKRRRNIPKF